MGAIRDNDINLVTELLQNPEIYETANINNNIALQIASQNGFLEIVKLLLEVPRIYDTANTDGNKALRLASEYDHIEIARLLLEVPCVQETLNSDKILSLQVASQLGSTEMVEMLLEDQKVRENANANNNRALRMASFNGQTEIVGLLLGIPRVRGAANALKNYALRMASHYGHTEIVRLLLEVPCVISNESLVFATQIDRFGHFGSGFKIVNLLLYAGSDPSENDHLALRVAFDNRHLDIADRLMQDPRCTMYIEERSVAESIRKYRKSDLIQSIKKDDIERVKQIINNDIVLNYVGFYDYALKYAIIKNKRTIFEYILKCYIRSKILTDNVVMFIRHYGLIDTELARFLTISGYNNFLTRAERELSFLKKVSQYLRHSEVPSENVLSKVLEDKDIGGNILSFFEPPSYLSKKRYSRKTIRKNKRRNFKNTTRKSSLKKKIIKKKIK